MARKIEITDAQLKAIVRMTDTLSAMVGCSDEEFDKPIKHDVKLVDKMLEKNKLAPRNYK